MLLLSQFLLCFASIFVLVHGYAMRSFVNLDIQERSDNQLMCDPCLNGHCTGPGTCICNDGYSLNTNLDCAPLCTKQCQNGTCIAPNECECKPGFHRDLTSFNICIPDCPNCTDGDCINGKCLCRPGFKKVVTDEKESACRAVCDFTCGNGTCVSHEKCDCYPGFEQKSPGQMCQPVCNDICSNGICIAPEQCECNAGYKFEDNSNTSCSPVCSDCKSGNCVEPEKCECFEGYRLVTNSTTNKTVCEPICEPPCVNGTCVAEGVCWSNLGPNKEIYQTNYACESSCEGICEFGKCIPICKDGFKLSTTDSKVYVCNAVCKSPCGNGTCVAPDKCDCYPGFEQKLLGQMCEPVCSNGCFKGVCIAPELCKCNAGYKFDTNSNNSCSPHCSNGCDFGTCVGPDDCQCFPGYLRITNSSTNRISCQLNCEPTCENGTCTVADLCLSQPCGPSCLKCKNGICLEFCESRYELKTFEPNVTKCEPICNPSCVNSSCIAPGVCSCLKGYEPDKENYTCKPVCNNGCKNGVCIKPDSCNCDPGYEFKGHINGCMPRCKIDCGNGTCIKPDTCHCDDGYVSVIKGKNMNTRHCVLTPEVVPNPDSSAISGEYSNNAVFLALSILASSAVAAAALAVYYFKFYQRGSYLTQEACHPQQMNSSF